jgi:hypothetical protein
MQVKTGLDYSWYMGVSGDGTNIYTGNTGTGRPMFVSPETDGQTWTPYQGGAQTFTSEPFEMFFDSTNGIMYSANWGGLYALKVLGKNSAVRPIVPAAAKRANPVLVIGDGIRARYRDETYTLPGRLIPERRGPRLP